MRLACMLETAIRAALVAVEVTCWELSGAGAAALGAVCIAGAGTCGDGAL